MKLEETFSLYTTSISVCEKEKCQKAGLKKMLVELRNKNCDGIRVEKVADNRCHFHSYMKIVEPLDPVSYQKALNNYLKNN